MGTIEKEFIFIIGAPRSGSTWLQQIIGAHPKVASIEAELTVFNRYVRPFVNQFEIEEKPVFEGKWKQGLPVIYTRAEIDKYIQQFINDVYGHIDKKTATHILDKHPHYSEVVDLINYYLPKAKFINIVRDGREAAISWHKSFKTHGFGAASIEKAARDWKHFVEQASNARKFGTDKYLEIKYRNLLVNPMASIMEIYDFCGLEYDEKLIKEIVDLYFGEKNMFSGPTSGIPIKDRIVGSNYENELSMADRIHFDRIAGKLLEDYGFENGKKWIGNTILVTFVKFTLSLKALWRKLKKTLGALLYG